ncbi:MAG: PAS domain S-box protein [Anaerolineales bacterium]|nr:PAS domain S-box protein [Anaerolineales bacterium]
MTEILHDIKNERALRHSGLNPERTQNQQELNHHDEKYKNLFENSLVGIFRTSLADDLILEANATLEKMLGFETLVGLRTIDFYVDPHDRDIAKLRLQQTGSVEHFETRFKRSDGAIVWVSFSARMYPLKDYLEGVIIDITSRKKIEADLEGLLATEREQRLRAEILSQVTLALTAQTSPAAVLEEILHQVQQIVPCQKATIRLLTGDSLRIAYKQGEMAFDTQQTPGKDRALAEFPFDAEAVQSHQTLIIPDTLKEPRWVSLPHTTWVRSHIAAPICLGDRVLGLLGLDADTPGKFSAEDAERLKPFVNAAAIALENAHLHEQARRELAERKRAEEALATERNLLRTLIDNVPDFIYVKDKESRFLLGSKAVARVLGVPSPDDLVGKTDFDFLNRELAEQYYAVEKSVIESGQPIINNEEPFIAPNSDKKEWYSTSTVPLRDSHDQIVGIIGLSHNISKLKETEQALRGSQARLKLLNSISTRVNAGLSASQIIQRTLNQVADYFPTLRVGYSTIDEQGNVVQIYAIEPSGMPPLTTMTFNLATSPNYFELLRRRKPIIVEDVNQDSRLGGLSDIVAAGGTKAFIDIPLHHSDNLIGVLCLDASEIRQWSEHEITTVTEVAEYLSIALQNAREQQERERAEAELRASEERFRLVVDSISDHIYVTRVTDTGEHINLYLSPHAKVLTGYPMEKFMADWRFWPSTVIHPHDRATAAAQVAQQEKGQHSEVEYRLVRADGTVIWVRDSVRVQPEGSSSKVVFGLVSDITERKQAELEREWLTNELRNINQTLDERVRARTAELQAIFDAVGEGILVTNLAGAIEYINPAMEKLTGYSSAETVGKTPRIWKSEQQNPVFYTKMWQTIRTGQTWRGELVNKRKDGSLYDVLLTITPIPGPDGQPTGFVGVQNDITPFKEMDRLKSEFISVAAHELRTPLTSILGFSEILLTRQLNDERRNRYLTFINQQADALRAILDDLLDLSRLEAGEGFEIIEDVVDLKKIAEETIFGFQENQQAHHYHLIGASSWPQIKGDAVKLAQLFKNLLSNATKYSPAGGDIILEAKIEEAYNLLHLTLTDHGIGMTPEQMAQVFDRFYRADASNTAIGGTGLGMTISRLIVERHRGKIWIESQYGVGTTVHILLPFRNRPLYILIIEDDQNLRELQQRILRTEGFVVLGAGDGSEGLKLANACFPNLILLDLALPGMTGFDVLECLQRDYLTKDIPVIITSAMDTTTEIERAIQKGAVDYLVKPYGMADLTVRVNRALIKSSTHAQASIEGMNKSITS